jgi:hypothetical protein
MKGLAVFSTTALAVLLGVSAPVYAQQEEHPQQEERRAQPEEKRAQPEDKAAHEQEKQVDKQREDKRPDQENRREDKNAKQEDKSARQDERRDQRVNQREDHRGRIPDDRFRANFGREHRFHIGRPVVVEGAPRFQYGGYWFVFVEPWPEGWGYDDEVYVDYIDGGYYLLSPVHPGVQISINVVF